MTEKREKVEAARILRNPACFLALGFGSGLAPKAPGTFGTLAAIPIYLALSALPFPAYLATILILFLAGIWICGRCEHELGCQDHSGIVWDEFVGFLIAMAATPVSWPSLVCGFCLFRLFDIIKPWPIRLLDRQIHGGLGIMLDDALAGAFAWCILFLLKPWLAGLG